MPGLREIVNKPWNDVDIFADSIPHLLHWDFAYLWVLMKPEDQQPRNWKHRVLAWRKLVALFLLGQLRVQPEAVPETFAAYLRQAGLTGVSALYLGDRRVGVLSPVVLLRPFPDVAEDEIAAWPTEETTKRDELRYFAGILQNKLREDPVSPVRQALACIAERHFGPRGATTGSYNGSPRHATLLPGLKWTDDTTPETVEVLVSDGETFRTYVPRCATCTELLLQKPTQPAVQVTGGQLRLACPAGHENHVALDRLMLWERPGDVIAWTDRSVPMAGEQPEFPPQVSIEGPAVRFTWNPGTIGGEAHRTVLRLVFPNKAATLCSFRDICFRRLLVPGADTAHFRGIPVRPQWFDALEAPNDVSVQVLDGNVEIRGLKLKGWPFAFSTCLGNLGVERAKELSVGVFPRPMFAGWKRYRVFASGAEGYHVTHPGPIRGPVVETREGWPQVVSVESAASEAGVTWYVPEPCLAVEQQPNVYLANVYLGIDFGTAYSVVYYSGDGETRRPVEPVHISSCIYWIAAVANSVPPFLPADRDTHATDPWLFPSALWWSQAGAPHLIRWNERPPDGACALHGFKWDHAPQSFDEERLAYLSELLFLCIPEALAGLGIPKGPANLRLGFAYPLAFSYDSRRRLHGSLESLRQRLRQQTGCEATAYSINESRASVRAFGMHEPGETFLVADMGGGTLDLGLCRFNPQGPDNFLQIGSLRFAGEAWLHAVARRIAPGEAEFEASYWKLRDALSRGNVGDLYPNDTQIAELLDRFLPMALEFVRTMLAAFRQQHPDDPVKVLLVGNGWRLCELSAGAGVNPQQALRAFYKTRLAWFDLPGVELYYHDIPGVASVKHLVAFGALRNARTEQEKELQGDAYYPSLLPAGRRLSFRLPGRALDIKWHHLVGDGWVFEAPPAELRAATIDCDVQQGPASPARWEPWLRAALPHSRYPRAEELRQAILDEIKGSTFLFKGPLQLVLENHWRPSLERTEHGMAAGTP